MASGQHKSRLDRAVVRRAREIIRERAFADLVTKCIKEAARLYGCKASELIAENRGSAAAARARVVAMNACVALGVPMATTARAFRRCRRSVHSAMRIGKPGREERDEAVLEGFRAVVKAIREEKLAYLSERSGS